MRTKYLGHDAEQIRMGNQRLLELGQFVVEYQTSGYADDGYDQRHLIHICGAPACLLGHGYAKWPKDLSIVDCDAEFKFFAITQREWDILFGSYGCDNAEKDWRKAVRFVRGFVARRAAMLKETAHG